MFQPGMADLSGINGKGDLYLQHVLHRATVEVDERGTQAEAGSGATVGYFGGPPPKEEPLVFRADRPFLFLIRDNTTGVILFLGRVMTPETL